jgi:hypothetical protein
MRKTLLIIGSILGISALEALGIYSAWLLGVTKDEIIKVIPIVTAYVIGTFVALLIAIFRFFGTAPRLSISAENVGQNIALVVHVQNNSQRFALHVITVNMPRFASECEYKNEDDEDHPIVKCSLGRDIKYRLTRLGDTSTRDLISQEITRHNKLKATIPIRFEGSKKVKKIIIKFDNPFIK